jgi:hypothetical protein
MEIDDVGIKNVKKKRDIPQTHSFKKQKTSNEFEFKKSLEIQKENANTFARIANPNVSFPQLFPLMLPMNVDFSSYGGYITVQVWNKSFCFLTCWFHMKGREFALQVNFPAISDALYPLKGGEIICSGELKEMVAGYEDTIQQVKWHRLSKSYGDRE